jgi:hypothetical protein
MLLQSSAEVEQHQGSREEQIQDEQCTMLKFSISRHANFVRLRMHHE